MEGGKYLMQVSFTLDSEDDALVGCILEQEWLDMMEKLKDRFKDDEIKFDDAVLNLTNKDFKVFKNVEFHTDGRIERMEIK